MTQERSLWESARWHLMPGTKAVSKASCDRNGPQGQIPRQPKSLEGRGNAGQEVSPRGSLCQPSHLGHPPAMLSSYEAMT